MASRARCVATSISRGLSFQVPIPSSTEAILAFSAHDSLTAETCANRFAHSRLVIMMISSELTEILGMSDRILVLHRGRVAAELPAQGATQERVLSAALGRAS